MRAFIREVLVPTVVRQVRPTTINRIVPKPAVTVVSDRTRRTLNLPVISNLARFVRNTVPGGVGVGIAVNNAGLTNGKIPRNALVDIGGGNLLRSDAATQFNRMRAAYKRDTGRELGISSAYRDYAWQQRLYNNRGSNRYPVAKPGKSKHGWGLAVDVNLPGNDYNNPTYKWLTKNAKQFGFHTIKGDPVHWQYGG